MSVCLNPVMSNVPHTAIQYLPFYL